MGRRLCNWQTHWKFNIAVVDVRRLLATCDPSHSRKRNRNHWNSTSLTSYLSFALFTLTCRVVVHSLLFDRHLLFCSTAAEGRRLIFCICTVDRKTKCLKHHWKFSNFKEVKFLSIFQFFLVVAVVVAGLEFFFSHKMKCFDPHFSPTFFTIRRREWKEEERRNLRWSRRTNSDHQTSNEQKQQREESKSNFETHNIATTWKKRMKITSNCKWDCRKRRKKCSMHCAHKTNENNQKLNFKLNLLPFFCQRRLFCIVMYANLSHVNSLGVVYVQHNSGEWITILKHCINLQFALMWIFIVCLNSMLDDLHLLSVLMPQAMTMCSLYLSTWFLELYLAKMTLFLLLCDIHYFHASDVRLFTHVCIPTTHPRIQSRYINLDAFKHFSNSPAMHLTELSHAN